MSDGTAGRWSTVSRSGVGAPDARASTRRIKKERNSGGRKERKKKRGERDAAFLQTPPRLPSRCPPAVPAQTRRASRDGTARGAAQRAAPPGQRGPAVARGRRTASAVQHHSRGKRRKKGIQRRRGRSASAALAGHKARRPPHRRARLLLGRRTCAAPAKDTREARLGNAGKARQGEGSGVWQKQRSGAVFSSAAAEGRSSSSSRRRAAVAAASGHRRRQCSAQAEHKAGKRAQESIATRAVAVRLRRLSLPRLLGNLRRGGVHLRVGRRVTHGGEWRGRGKGRRGRGDWHSSERRDALHSHHVLIC